MEVVPWHMQTWNWKVQLSSDWILGVGGANLKNQLKNVSYQ